MLIHVPAGDPTFDDQVFGLDLVEDPIIVALEREGVGELDGNDIGADEAVIYVYGPDADRIAQVVIPVLRRLDLPPRNHAGQAVRRPRRTQSDDANRGVMCRAVPRENFRA